MLNDYINFILFAFVVSITPGPTNLICFALGSNKGILSVLPFAIGSSFGAAFILWLSGFGLASLMVSFPIIKAIMAWTGVLWISYLAYLLFITANQQALKAEPNTLGYRSGAFLQLLNPKTWLMALSVNGVFSLPQVENNHHMLYLSVIFFVVAMPCLFSWHWLGRSVRLFKQFPKWQMLMNRSLALLLLATAWLSVLMMD